MRCFTLLLIATLAAAADPIGVWRYGIGTVDGQPATVGTLVLTGQTVVSANAAPLRLVCQEAPGITVILAAGSTGRFMLEDDQAGGRLLVLELDLGAVQVDVRDRGPYAGVRVRGYAADVKVTGTLFTVERVRRDADYVALVRGKVKVGLRPAVAKAANRPEGDEIELTEHQGLSADGNGLGTPEGLSSRPQLNLPSGLRAGTREQGLGLSDQGTGWGSDLGGELTGALLEGAAPPPPPGDLGGPSLFGGLAEDLSNTLQELGQPPQPTTDSTTSGSTPPPAGAPGLPPPPPPPPAP